MACLIRTDRGAPKRCPTNDAVRTMCNLKIASRSIAVAAFLVASAVHGDLLFDDFSTPYTESNITISSPPFTPPKGSCTIFGSNAPASNPCVRISEQSASILGGERDVFAAILGVSSPGSINVQLGPNPFNAAELDFTLNTGSGVLSYSRIEWDGIDGLADDNVSITNRLDDLPCNAGNSDCAAPNPFSTPATTNNPSIDNPDEFFGRPLNTTAGILQSGLDNDDLDGKLDHSTVDWATGLGGINLLGIGEMSDAEFLISLSDTDIVGAFRITVYSAPRSGAPQGSYFDGQFVAESSSFSASFSKFQKIPDDPTGRSQYSTYGAVDFTSVTAVVLELMNDRPIDIEIARIAAIFPPALPVPPTLILLISGLLTMVLLRWHVAKRRQREICIRI